MENQQLFTNVIGQIKVAAEIKFTLISRISKSAEGYATVTPGSQMCVQKY